MPPPPPPHTPPLLARQAAPLGPVYSPVAIVTRETTGAPRARPLVVFGTMAARVVALDLETGALAWQAALGGSVEAAPVVGPDGVVYVGCYDWRLYALSPTAGAVLWSFRASQSIVVPPALAADRSGLYVTSYDKNFYKASRVVGALSDFIAWHSLACPPSDGRRSA